MDNEQILPALLAQDLDRYFWELAVASQDQLYAFALHLTGSVQDAEDIVQEALYNILSILDTASQVEQIGRAHV